MYLENVVGEDCKGNEISREFKDSKGYEEFKVFKKLQISKEREESKDLIGFEGWQGRWCWVK